MMCSSKNICKITATFLLFQLISVLDFTVVFLGRIVHNHHLSTLFLSLCKKVSTLPSFFAERRHVGLYSLSCSLFLFVFSRRWNLLILLLLTSHLASPLMGLFYVLSRFYHPPKCSHHLGPDVSPNLISRTKFEFCLPPPCCISFPGVLPVVRDKCMQM